MEGNEFVFKKEGTTLHVYLGFELSIANSAALREMFEAYRGQDISKIVFDATDLVFLSSSGIRVIIFATQEIGKQPKIVFVNCAEEIQNTFKITGLVNFFSFVEDKSMLISSVLWKTRARPIRRKMTKPKRINGRKNISKLDRSNLITLPLITMWWFIR